MRKDVLPLLWLINTPAKSWIDIIPIQNRIVCGYRHTITETYTYPCPCLYLPIPTRIHYTYTSYTYIIYHMSYMSYFIHHIHTHSPPKRCKKKNPASIVIKKKTSTAWGCRPEVYHVTNSLGFVWGCSGFGFHLGCLGFFQRFWWDFTFRAYLGVHVIFRF